MHRLSRLSVFTLCVLVLCAFAGSALADGGSFTGSALVPDKAMVIPDKAMVIPNKAANLTYFTDRATFEAAAPDLTKETFDSGLVGPGGVVACSDPTSAADSGGCFPAGTLQTGFSYASSSGFRVVILGAGVVGQPTTAIAADLFADSNVISFSNPDVFAVGFDAFGFGGPFTVSVFSANGLEGQTLVSPPGFFGVKSDTLITSIDIASAGGGEVVDNLCYGRGVLSPEELIADLLDFIDSLDLNGGTANALTSKLENALASLDAGNETAAVNQLEAAKNSVEAQAGKQIDAADAQLILDALCAIIDAIEAP